MGDILPNQKNFRFIKRKNGEKSRPSVELGNVTQKVHNAILAVLDMHFACNCDEFTIQQTYEIDNIGTIMEAHINVLWNLKQAIMYEKPRGTLMRKLHAHNHIGEHIRQFGAIVYANTDAFESSHKFFTTGVWRGTSKRLGTLVKEMTTASIIQSHAIHLTFFTTLLPEDGISQCLKTFGPKIVSDGLVINAFTNVSDIRFIVTSEKNRDGITNILKGVGSNKELFSETIFGHNSLPSSKHLSQYLRSHFSEKVWDAMTVENTMVEFSIVRSASYEGSKESDVGKGVLYATAGNADKGPRYDYITVKTMYTDKDTGDEVESYTIAQVLVIVQVHIFEHNHQNKRVLKNNNNWYLIVQYMQKATGSLYKKPHTIQHESIAKYSWEMRDKKSSDCIPANNTDFYIDMISIDSMIGPAMIIPYFSFQTKKKTNNGIILQKVGTPKINNPHLSDMFWYVDRKFFDRSGWEELNDSNIEDNNTNINVINTDNIQSFLEKHYIDQTDEPLPNLVPWKEPDFEEFLSDYEDDNMLVDEDDDEEDLFS